MADKIPSNWSTPTIEAIQRRLGIWNSLLSGAYASVNTFVFTGDDRDANLVKKSIFSCTDSTGATRRHGYIKSAVNNSGTITVTVVTDSNLASGDKDFKVTSMQKVYPFIHFVRVPLQVTGDAVNSIGLWNLDLIEDMKFISSSVKAITPAAGAGAAMTWNVYANSTALYGTAPDLGVNTYLRDQRPTTIDVVEGSDVSVRILTAGGATNYAANVQFRIVMIPTSLFLTI